MQIITLQIIIKKFNKGHQYSKILINNKILYQILLKIFRLSLLKFLKIKSKKH